MSDGKVTFRTGLDNSGLEKDLAKVSKKIEDTENKLNGKKTIQSSIKVELDSAKEEARKTEEEIDRLKIKVSELREFGEMSGIKNPIGLFETETELKRQESILNSQNREAEKLGNQYTKITDEVQNLTDSLNEARKKAGGITEELSKAPKTNIFDNAVGDMNKRFDKLQGRISKLAARALVFSTITSGLNALKSYFGDVISANDETSAAIGRLKGALLTMVQPLISVVIPALTTLINLLTAIVGKIATFLSALGGKTAKQSAEAAKTLNKQATAIGGVGSAAEEAEKQLMGFDEINKLSSTDTSSGGGGGTGDIQPDFGWSEGISETLDRIADLVLLIGAGFALWKISEMIPGKLGSILGNLGLIMAALGGLLLLYDGIQDAWENGVDWGNMAEMIAGLAVAAGALYLAFGPLAAGITLVVGGIALLITAFHDIMENGFSLQNTLLAIAGIFATGLGITLLTGSLIPLLIAAIASLLLAFTVATGHGEELISGLKKTCQGFLDFFSGIFTGDMEKAFSGLRTMFSGFKEAGLTVLSGLGDAMLAFMTWLNEKTGGAVNGVISVINRMIAAVVNGINALFRLLSFQINLPGGGSIGWSLPQFDIPQIPYLAQGAVIPPNREFLAVLGDQKNGTNIEAPEDLIRKIVREETAGAGNNEEIVELLELLIQTVQGIKVGDEVIGRAAARYQRKTSRAMGV